LVRVAARLDPALERRVALDAPAVAWMLLRKTWADARHPVAPRRVVMKLVNRKTRKLIEKSVRKAMKKHGPALIAAMASSLVSTIATLANTDASDKPGKSKLGDVVEQAAGALVGGKKGQRGRQQKKTARRRADYTERTQPSVS